MKSRPDSLSSAVRQFRHMTAGDAEGGATRARVLAEVDRRQGPNDRVRRTRVVVAVMVAVLGSAALAATEAAHHRTPVPVALTWTDPRPELDSRQAPRRRWTIPAVAAVTVSPAGPASDPEDQLYGEAHAAHFRSEHPQRALAAWTEYLRRFPGGRFAPEARFNRAVCLIRLRRYEAAARALAPFAAGRFGSYRRPEAQRLIDWLTPVAPGAP